MPTDTFTIDGYELKRADHLKVGKKPGGGCALYIRDNTIFEEKTELIPHGLEGICGYVNFPNHQKGIVANIDRPPSENSNISWFDKMDTLLDNFSKTKLEYIIIGDLNCDLLKQPLENHTKHYIYTCETHQLTQSIDKPTRITSRIKTLIDMVMMSDPNKIVEYDVKSVGFADHCLVYCVTSYKSHVRSTQSHRIIQLRNYKNFNEQDFISDLELCDWISKEQYDDVDEAYSKWKHIFTEVRDKHCLLVSQRVRKCFLLWLNDQIKEDIRSKHNYEKKAHVKGLEIFWQMFPDFRNVVSNCRKKAKCDYYHTGIILENKNKPKLM